MDGPFPSSLDLNLFLIVFFLWCASLVSERFLVKRKRSNIVKSREDKGTYLLIYLSVFISIIVSFNFGFNDILLLPSFFMYVGMVAILFGIIIREYSIIVLGKYFSFQITVIKGHKIVENGLYRYIRHPAYTGAILGILGISLSLRSSIAVAIVLLVCLIAYGSRINYEEKALLKEFGTDYQNYQKRTKRIIPFLF